LQDFCFFLPIPACWDHRCPSAKSVVSSSPIAPGPCGLLKVDSLRSPYGLPSAVFLRCTPILSSIVSPLPHSHRNCSSADRFYPCSSMPSVVNNSTLGFYISGLEFLLCHALKFLIIRHQAV
jgi:hypothetical protein